MKITCKIRDLEAIPAKDREGMTLTGPYGLTRNFKRDRKDFSKFDDMTITYSKIAFVKKSNTYDTVKRLCNSHIKSRIEDYCIWNQHCQGYRGLDLGIYFYYKYCDVVDEEGNILLSCKDLLNDYLDQLTNLEIEQSTVRFRGKIHKYTDEDYNAIMDRVVHAPGMFDLFVLRQDNYSLESYYMYKKSHKIPFTRKEKEYFNEPLCLHLMEHDFTYDHRYQSYFIQARWYQFLKGLFETTNSFIPLRKQMHPMYNTLLQSDRINHRIQATKLEFENKKPLKDQ